MTSLPGSSGQQSLLAGLYGRHRRQKNDSECSESSVGMYQEELGGSLGCGTLVPSNLATSLGSGEERPEHYLYDVDGVFAYTFYEKKPQMYDVEGKIRYK